MPVYRTLLHRRLMEESEKGLFAAVTSGEARWAHIAEDVVYDCHKFFAWEAHHARLIEPLAESRRRGPTLASLRHIEMNLVHRRAFFDTLREQKITGAVRERLFRIFYGPRDYRNSVLSEHSHYQLAVASSLAAARLSEVCKDPAGAYLLDKYETAYRRYYWAFCQWRLNENPLLDDVLHLSVEAARAPVDRLKERLRAGRDLSAWARERLQLQA